MQEDLIPGFSHEYINYMLGGTYRASFRPLNDAIMTGRIRGVAAIVGCNNPRSKQDYLHTYVTQELLKQDVLVVETGCGAIASAKLGLLLGEAGLDKVGPGLREICETVGIPPVLHMGSCVDNTRILTVLTQMVEEGGLGDDIDQIPAVGLAPEWMSEKALAIGTYCVASGAYVIFGGSSPVSGMPDRVADSDIVLHYISEGWEKLYGGKLEFVADPDEMIRRTLAHIDKKRAALGLPEYDPSALAAAAMSACWNWKRCRWQSAAKRSTAWLPTKQIGIAGWRSNVTIHCYPSHPRRKCPGHRSRADAAQSPGGKRPRYTGRFPEHGLLSAADLRDDRHSGGKPWASWSRSCSTPASCCTRSHPAGTGHLTWARPWTAAWRPCWPPRRSKRSALSTACSPNPCPASNWLAALPSPARMRQRLERVWMVT